MYYKNKYSQQKIADMLHVSRPWISKLLARAEETGIVEIRVNASVNELPDLSDQACRHFGLDYACVVRDDDSGVDHAAIAAANYFLSQLREGMTVGVSWGRSVTRVMEYIPEYDIPDLRVVPMAGSFGTSAEDLPNYNALKVAEKTGGTAALLHVPAFCATAEEYEAIRGTAACSEVLDQAERADVALVGVGALEDSFLMRQSVLTREQRLEMSHIGIVGDMCLNFINADGCRVHNELTDKIICADMQKVRRNARSVTVFAEGAKKVATIRAVLRGGLATALITNEETARLLLDFHDNP